MPYTPAQLEFLSVRMGVAIPPANLENQRLAGEFAKRSAALSARAAAGKPRSDLPKLQALFNQATAAAARKDLATALTLLDQVEAGLALPDAPPSTAPKPAADGRKTALAQWAAARSAAIAKLNELGRNIAAFKHEKSAKALIQVKAVVANLSAKPGTLQKVAELERYLTQDDVVLDVCRFSEDIRPPLVGALTQLKRQFAA